MYWMGVSRVLRGRFLCTGWMFLMRLPPAWYAGYLTLLMGVYKQWTGLLEWWNSGLDYWNGGIVDWVVFRFYF